jgi:hypothetical protein
MNRRKFLSWLGVGSAAVAVAPYALLNGEPVYVAGCSCAGQSFWDGRCEYCNIHKMECGCDRSKGCTCPVLTFTDYRNFSSFAIASSIDSMVSQSAAELGHQAGLSLRQLHRGVFDGT